MTALPPEKPSPDRAASEVVAVGNVAPARVPRPDRVNTVAMTARVPLRLRRIYDVLAAELGVAKNELHETALRSLLLRFRVRSEWPIEWEKLKAELRGDGNEGAS